MSKIQILSTDETRYSKNEIDIFCRACYGNLGDILHICPKKLVTQCRNCNQITEIETGFQKSY
jgi:hypothetical protein